MSTSAGRRYLVKPSNILFQVPRRSFATQTRPRLQRPQIKLRAYISLTPGPHHLLTISPTVRSTVSRAGPEQLLGASVLLGLIYSVAWALDFTPSSLIFEQDTTPYVFLPELNHRLESVVPPAEFDFTNDAFFALLSRSRPLKYGFHIREAQTNAAKAKVSVAELEKELQGTRCVCKSPPDQLKRVEVKKELREERVRERLYRERWVKLWMLDVKEGERAYKRRGKTMVGVVRGWMGWDLEGAAVEMVKMGFIKV